jgi:hypothetical protein
MLPKAVKTPLPHKKTGLGLLNRTNMVFFMEQRKGQLKE